MSIVGQPDAIHIVSGKFMHNVWKTQWRGEGNYGVFRQPQHCCITESDFVQILKHVGDEHQWHQTLIR